MKIRTILNLIIVTTLAVLTASCDKGESLSSLPTDITPDLKFTKLELIEATFNSATIRVQHNGTKADRWYGFVTDNIAASDAVLIQGKIDELTKDGKITGLDKRTSARIVLNGLKPDKKYRYIVFATTENGQIYSKASIKFDTEATVAIMEKVTNWSITYNGRTDDNCDSFSVQNNDKSPLYVTFVNKLNINMLEESEEFKTYGGLRLLDENDEVIALLNAEEALVYMEMLNVIQYAKEYDIDEFTYADSFTGPLDRKQSGEYLAICIACNNDGPTGYYSCDYIEIAPETATDDYKKWIGTWKFTAANGIEYTMELIEEDPNFIYAAKGWECNESLGEDNDFSAYSDLAIPMYYDKLTTKFYIKSYDFGPTTNGSSTYWGLFGWYEVTENSETKDIPYISDEKVCEAVYSETEPIQLTAGKVGDFEENYIYSGLRYTTYSYQTEGLAYGYWNELAEFPITMIKEADVEPTDANRSSKLTTYSINIELINGGLKINDTSRLKTTDFSKIRLFN